MASPSTLVPPQAGSSRGPVPIPEDAHHRPHRHDRISPIARSLALAAAIVGTLEVVLHRTGAPVVSHVPGVPGGPSTAEAIRLTGRAALEATALLVLLLALALGLHLWKRHRLIAILLLVSVGAAIGRTSVPDSAWAAAAYALTAAAIVGVVVMAARSVPRLHAAAIGTAALGFMAGLYPIAAQAIVTSGNLSRAGGIAHTAVSRLDRGSSRLRRSTDCMARSAGDTPPRRRHHPACRCRDRAPLAPSQRDARRRPGAPLDTRRRRR